MSTKQFTERALEHALKELMKIHPINKITIKMITDYCGVTRHTFYNHFSDIYELLGSLFEHEVIEDLEKYCHVSYWKQGIYLVLQYTLDNKTVCLNTFRSLGREHLEIFLYKTFRKMLDGIIDSIDKEQKANRIHKIEVADFFSYAVVGQFLAWLNDGLREKPEVIADRIGRMLEGTISRLILSK